MRGHIVTCLSSDELNKFIESGYAGVMPILLKTEDAITSRKLASKIGTNWDVIADLKRVKIGDYIFLHTEKRIYGPYVATTSFLESPDTPEFLKSKNLKISFWLENYPKSMCHEHDYFWKVGIKSIGGVTKEKGFSSMELFKLRSLGLIQSIPQRFQYHDKPKIVKPLLNHELQVILELLNKVDCDSYITVIPMELSDHLRIQLNLDSYGGELYREKILEAWIMENVTLNGNNAVEHSNMRQSIGVANHFSNSIFTYYTNFMDVIFYDEVEQLTNEYCSICNKYSSKNKTNIRAIELKKGRVQEDTLYQIQEYQDWVVKCLADGDASKVKAIIIGKDFSEGFYSQRNVRCVRYELCEKEPYLKLYNEVNLINLLN